MQAIQRLESQWSDTFATPMMVTNDNFSKRKIKAVNFLRENGSYLSRGIIGGSYQ